MKKYLETDIYECYASASKDIKCGTPSEFVSSIIPSW